MSDQQPTSEQLSEAITRALEFVWANAGVDGAHHKQWVIDQIVRILTLSPEGYRQWVTQYEEVDEWGDQQDWDSGIAP